MLVDISLSKSQFDILKGIDAEELFITSSVNQSILNGKENEIIAVVTKAKGTKCSRCWKIVLEVKGNKCSRCFKIK